MKVLWFSCTPSCYDVKVNGGWVESLELIVRKYLPNIELGIVFEHEDAIFKIDKNGVSYYPVHANWTLLEKLINLFCPSAEKKYLKLKPLYIKAIDDFKPDIVQCFGTELWHYSILQKNFKLPFVVHIMGFWHAIQMADTSFKLNNSYLDTLNPIKILKQHRNFKDAIEHMALERQSMHYVRYFMGRTDWDKDIVKYCTNNAKYFHCPEAIRNSIINSPMKWRYKEDDTIRLITISNAGKLKGNEVILKTAWILRNHFKKNVEWRYTTSRNKMLLYEKKIGIKCKDVGLNLIGRLKSNEIPNELCSAQIFVHPSVIENSSNAVCEAQLLGVPIIASNVGGMPQIIDHGITGILYPYNEPYALAIQILKLHNNREYLENLSKNAFKVAHERHNPEKIASTLNVIYENIIEDFNKSR